MNSHSIADLVRRFYEGWNNGSIDFADLVAEDIVNHQPEAEPEQGRQRFEEAVKGCHASGARLAVDSLGSVG